MTTDKEMVAMTAEERAEFEAYQQAKAKREAEERRRSELATYRAMVDDEIANCIPILQELSESIRITKQTVLENFRAVLEMKERFLERKVDGQLSHTFTNSDGTMRVKLGVHFVDAYRDTVDDGVAMVKDFISSLAKDERTKKLVEMVLKLLSPGANGTIKASRIVQLRRIAEDFGDDRFLNGVRIIEESYQPEITKQYVCAYIKPDGGAWTPIPLGMTES